MRVTLRRTFLFSLVFLTAVECALERTDFVHDGKRYTILQTSKSPRPKRETTNTTTTINECYQFTAVGGLANETTFESSVEATCTKLDKTTPCFLPYVFTEDGSLPDPSAVASHCKDFGCKVTCAKSSHSCVRYSHVINGVTSNITYFCGDVQDTTDDVVLKNGQVSDTLSGGIVREVFFCQTPRCNSSPSNPISIFMFVLPFLFLLFK